MDSIQLQLNSDLFQLAIEQTPASIFIMDADGSIVYANSFFTQMSGYTLEEVKGKNPGILRSDYQEKPFYKELWNTVRAGKTWNGDIQNKKKSGELYWERVTIRPINNNNGEITHYLAVKQDITEEKQRELEVSRRERILNDIETLSKAGGWEFDVETGEMFWTDELYRIHGFDPQKERDHINESLQCYYPEDRELVEKAFRDCIKDGKDYDLTLKFKDILGKKKWIRTKSHAVFNEDGNIVKIIGSVKDVSEEVALEQELVQKETRFREVIHAFDDIVFTLDKDGRHSEFYGNWAKNSEIKNLLIGKLASEVMDQEAFQKHTDAFNKAMNGETAVYTWTLTSGSTKICFQTKLTPIRSISGDITGVLGVGRNITAEVNIQKQLEETKERLNYSLEGTKAGTWDWDIESGKISFNERWASMLGYKLSELEPVTLEIWEDLMHPDDFSIAYRKLKKIITKEGSFFEARFRMKHKKGHWIWVQNRGKVFRNSNDGAPFRIAGTHLDITREMKSDLALVASEKRYKDLFTRSADANVLIKNDRIIDCNKAAYTMLGYAEKGDLIGKSPLELSPEFLPDGRSTKEAHIENLKQLRSKRSIKFEWYHQKKDKSLVPVEIVVTTIFDKDGENIGYVVWRDITNRKEAEKKLKDALHEKSVLLSEIHHRVKNNLAVISGLLQLQTYNIDDSNVTDMINASINRIKSIALIHEQLYKTSSFSNILLNLNIEKQAQAMLETFGSSSKTPISLDLSLDEVSININQALPVGLLINEILTNSFKHAFNGKDSGKISIALSERDGYIEILVADDGSGFDESEFTSESLGRSLIDTFIGQLEGELNLNTKEGTSYLIRFQKKDVKGSVAAKYV